MACNSTLDYLPDVVWKNIFGTLMCAVAVTASFENIIVLIVIFKCSALRTPSNRILASLATADLLTGAIVAPLNVAQYFRVSILHNCTVEAVRRYLSTALIGASTFTLGFISYDRCLHLVKLRKYKLEAKYLYPVLAICWLVPILLPFLRKINDSEQVYSATILTIGILVLVTVVVSYVGVIVSLRRFSNQCGSDIQQSSAENEKRASITVIIIITLYIFMLFPVFIHHGLNSSKLFDKYFIAKTYNITMLLAVANSSINPLIYCYRTMVLQKHIRQLFSDIFKRFRLTREHHSSSHAITVQSSFTESDNQIVDHVT